jgi:hypothetical protein
MTTGPSDVDESGFGLGGESSHDADVDAAYGTIPSESTTPVRDADGIVEDSADADRRAAYEDTSDEVSIIDTTRLHDG